MFEKFKYHILMHVIIFVWGFTGILGKLIHLSPELIVWYRVIIATIGLLFILPIMGVSYRLDNRKKMGWLVFVGIVTALHWVTFYKAISLSTASLGILCLSTTTLHVTWIEPIVMKRKFSWIEFALGLIVIYGIYFVSSDFKGDDYVALAYGLTAAFLAGVFSVANAKLAQKIPSPQITFYEMLTGIIFLTGWLYLDGQLTVEQLSMTTSDFLWLLFLGLVCTSLAFVLMIEVVKRLGAFTASLSINLEPVYTIILAIVILNEHELLGMNFYIGSLLIILVVIGNSIIKTKGIDFVSNLKSKQ